MKNRILNTSFVLIMSMMLTLVGCQEPTVEPTPVFPEKVSAVVEAGEQYEFTIDPNMAWTLSIPTEVATFFKFIVGESERYSLSGEAGIHTITIAVSNIEEFDVVRVCQVAMTMGGETKVVAEITRGAKERSMALYIAQYDTNEEMFATDADGNWVYNTTPTERIDWVWNQEQWMQRVMIESNFEWYLSPDAPEWLNINITNGKAGRSELFIRVNKEKLPLENVTCNIEFGTISIANSTDAGFEPIGIYPTEMEGCANVCELSISGVLSFNSNGDYYQASSDSYVEKVNGRFSSPRGAELVLLSKKADGTYANTAEETRWMRIKMDDFPEEAGDYGVWERSFTFEVGINSTTEQREGAIAAIAKPIAESGNYNPADYIVCTVEQEAKSLEEEKGAIYPNDETVMAAYNSKFEKLTNGSWPYVGAWSQVPYAYKLTYQGNNSGDDLIFVKSFTNYKIYGFNESSVYDNDTCWLTIEPSEEHKNLENGYKIKSRLGETIEDYTYTNPYAGDGGENEAFIFFYESEEAFNKDEAFAFIYFILDPNYTTPVDRPEGTVIFASDKDYGALGANLTEITKDMAEYSSEMAYAGTLQYMLTLNENCQEATLIVPNYLISYPYASWLYTTDGTGRITIHIDTAELPEVEAGVTEVRSNLTLYGEGYVQAVQLTVVYQL